MIQIKKVSYTFIRLCTAIRQRKEELLCIDFVPVLQVKEAILVPRKLGWSLDFPTKEKKILHNQNSAKPVIRLLKRFRDSNSILQTIKSYHIKVLVMNMIQSGFNFKMSPEKCFLEALKVLLKCLKQKYLPWTFDSKVNLWSDLCNFDKKIEFLEKYMK